MSDLDGVCMVKKGNTLVPADFHADEFLAEIKDGKEIIVSIRKARSPLHHRWFFALLRKVVDNSEKWGNEEDLLDDLKHATGHVRRSSHMLTGEVVMIAKSISFASMAEDAFKRFKDRCLYVLARAGFDTDALMKEVDDSQRRHANPRNG